MAALVLIGVISIGLAVLLVALLPGAGLVAAFVVLAGGVALIAWLLASGGARKPPTEAVRETETVEHLGPGGPDDPGR